MSAQVTLNLYGLLTITHPERGNEDNCSEICGEILSKVGAVKSSVFIYHDATGMLTANMAYATAFKELDKEISGKVVEIVCAIPGSIPRMLAHTVAMLSDKKWSIFREQAEAEEYLRFKGYLKETGIGPLPALGKHGSASLPASK